MGALKGFMTVIVMVMILPMVYFVLQPNMDVSTAQNHAIGGPASSISDKNNGMVPFTYIGMFFLTVVAAIVQALGLENASTYKKRN